MNQRLTLCCLLAVTAVLAPRSGSAQTAFSVAGQIGNFRVAVANYYHVPEKEVIVIRERRIREEEIPVVLFLSQQAHVAPSKVIALRETGRSWWMISLQFGLRPEVYYVPVNVEPGPPYGNAYGHYKKGRKRSRAIVLSDDDIVNLVHLRFLSEYYRVAPERVIEARSRQADFIVVHAEIGKMGTNPGRSRQDDNDRGGRGKGRGR